MALNNTRRLKIKSGNGREVYDHFGAFVTTGATVDIPVPFQNIQSVQLTPIGSPTVDEVLSVNGTPDTNGLIQRDASGNISIKRAATTTSGLKFYALIIGW